MAMLGMQADVQCSYFPGYYSARDLNLNASCCIWPLNNVDKIIKNGHYCNCSSSPPSLEQHLAHKEKLKQTMLQQEAIFREQISELHRLYDRQKQLMDEVRRSELYRHHLRQPYTLAAENNLSHLNYDQGKATQVRCDPAQAEFYIKESKLLESKCKKVGNKMLDLELPADEYIDSDEEESLARVKVHQVPEVPSYPVKIVSGDVQNNDGEQLLDTSDLNLVFQEDNMTQSPFSRKTTGFADLNEPIELDEDIKGSDPEVGGVASHVTGHKEISFQDLYGKTNQGFQVQLEIIQNTQTHGKPEACSKILNLEKNERHQDWADRLSENDEAGQSSSDLNSSPEGVCAETLSMSSDNAKIEQAHQASMSNPLDNSSGELQRKERKFGLKSTSNDCHLLVSDACKHTLNQVVPFADVVNCESSLVPSSRKHNHDFVRVPTAVQALPCFKNFVGMRGSTKGGSPGITGVNSRHSKNIKSKRKTYCLDVQNSFGKSEVEYVSVYTCPEKNIKGPGDVQVIRDIDLNSMSPSSCSQVSDESIWIGDGKKKLEESTEGSSHFGEKPIHIGISKKQCKRTTIQVEPACLQATTTSIPEVESKKFEATGTGRVERPLGVLMPKDPYKSSDLCSSHGFCHRTQENSSENEHANNGEKVGIVDINLDCNSVADSGEQQTANELVVDNIHREEFFGFGFSIDLNSGINEDESSPPTSSETTEIDLAALASPNENSQLKIKSDGNQGETSFQQLGQENGDLLEDLVMVAAEAIVSISSSEVKTCVESATFDPSEASRINSLYWFSRIANSVVDDPASEFGIVLSCKDTDHHDHSDGIDYFEAMTLQLKETQMEEYCWATNLQKEEATYPATFPSQPRKGRTRRGRQQQKDFQSEILPSLASLSRYEVTEDLHAIGGLVESSHNGWNTGSRKGSRNGCTRKRKPTVSSSNIEGAASLSLKPETRNSIEKSLIEWGKITRRPRGQRCPGSNPRLILAQV